MNREINRERIETLYESRFLRCYDLQYAEGKHYYEASRREKGDLVARKTGEEFREMLPDAVTIAVVLHLPGNETRLLMSYEYRYPVGQFLLSPVAGLLDPEDRHCDDPLVTAAIREIREETGLTLANYKLRGIVTFISDRWQTEYMFLYTATEWEGQLADCNEGTLEWIEKSKVYDLPLWEGDKIFFRLMEENHPYFSLKLRYVGEDLVEKVLDGKAL